MRFYPVFSAMFRPFWGLLLWVCLPLLALAQSDPAPFRPWFSQVSAISTDSLLGSLSEETQIGQLVWRSYKTPAAGAYTLSDVVSAILNHGLGGVLIETDDYRQLRSITSQLSQLPGQIPLIKGSNSGPWGLPASPEAELLMPDFAGALADPTQVTQWGRELAQLYQNAGIGFAIPQVLNLAAPVSETAFRGDADRVSLFIGAMQEAGVLAVAGTAPETVSPEYMTQIKRGLGQLPQLLPEIFYINTTFRGWPLVIPVAKRFMQENGSPLAMMSS
ncbi:MAG: hypothetical protein R3C61_10040 [Bacteroidia bacterium]